MKARPQQSFLSLLNPMVPARTLWRHRDLLWQFIVRNVEMRHKGSLLGLVWAVLNPLLMLALYVFVFGYVFGGRFGVVADETRWDYGLGVFLGLVVFHFIAETLAVAPSLIVGNQNFVKKVVFPLEILPVAAVGAAAFHMAISLAMVLAGVVLGGRSPSLSVLLLPFVLLPILGIALGIAWVAAALGVFFRDIGQVVGALTTGLMFASAIFYPASKVQAMPAAWSLLRFNPMIHIVEMSRDVVLWHRPIPIDDLAWLYTGSIALALFGYAVFGSLKRAFADVL